MLGTPVIVTKCPVFKELGIKNGVNGFLVNFDMTDLPIADIYTKKLEFQYTPPKSNWENVLVHKKSTYRKDKVVVECIKPYWDLQLSKNMTYKDRYEVPLARAAHLSSIGLVTIVDE